MKAAHVWHRRAIIARRLAATLRRDDMDRLEAYAAECDFRSGCLTTRRLRHCDGCPFAGEPCRGQPI